MSNRLRVGISWAALLLAGGCSTSTPATAPDYAIPPCVTNDSCATNKSGHVCSQGTCVVCASSADCPMGQKCDSMTACVQCLGAGDCPMGEQCQNKTCVVGCDQNNPCPMGKVCTGDTHVCVQCQSSTDCSGATPVCQLGSHTCVGCLMDSDCGAGKVCAANMCTTGCSAAHPQCGNGLVCSINQGACVACVTDTDCVAGQYCSANSCNVGCRGNADCVGNSAGTQCAVATHTCVQCVDDTGCPPGQTCSGNKCATGCTAQHPCSTGQGCCGGACVVLVNNAQNCGACGNACANGQGCCGGVCVSTTTVANCGSCGNACGPGKDCCGSSCAPLNTAQNCGGCGMACAAGSGCCGAGNTCAPLNTVTNCGACGNACAAGSLCCSGGCIDVTSDAKNCGSCGNACTNSLPCIGGLCGQPSSCAAILKANPSAGDNTYMIDPDGPGGNAAFNVWCNMTSQGGGWTLVAGIVPTDGNNVDWFNTNYWTGVAEFGTYSAHFSGDYKSPAATLMSGTQIMIQIASSSAANSTIGERGWALTSSATFTSYFSLPANTTITTSSLFTNANSVFAQEPLLKFGVNLVANRIDNPNGDATRLGVTARQYTGDDNCPGLGTAMNYSNYGNLYRHADVELQVPSNNNEWCTAPASDTWYKWLGGDVTCGGNCGGCQSAASPGYTPAWNYRIYMR